MQSKQTALMMAAEGGHLEVVEALIKAGADVYLRTLVCYMVMALSLSQILNQHVSFISLVCC